jgi:hypothetical protein
MGISKMNFDNVAIRLGSMPMKGVCLTFHSTEESLTNFNEKVIAFCNSQTQWSNSEFSNEFRRSHLFFQSVDPTYLMIEFWTADRPLIDRVVQILQEKFKFPDPVRT